jgi:hypothetical protein
MERDRHGGGVTTGTIIAIAILIAVLMILVT